MDDEDARKFVVGDLVEWDDTCDWVAPDKRTGEDDNTNSPRPLGCCQIVEIDRVGSLHVKILNTGKILTRTKHYDGPNATRWNPYCFKKVDKFVARIAEIYAEQA